jgi:hypothetical protein
MSIYGEFRELAEELIAEFGEQASIYTPEQPGGVDGLGRPKPPVARVDINGLATGLLNYNSKEIDGSLIKMGDAYIFFHSETNPDIGMYHEVNGKVYRVQDVNLIESRDGVVALCKIQLRRS